MALLVILVLYVSIGALAAAGSAGIARKMFPDRAEQIFFGLFLTAIAGFYLAFTAHFGRAESWRLEAGVALAFSALGVLGGRMPGALVLGYGLHGGWDLLHELHAHAGLEIDGLALTEIPLAYGAFCAAYDGCLALYFHLQRGRWRAAWRAPAH
jgi:hypothetical protein